jgi:hypothetical protein
MIHIINRKEGEFSKNDTITSNNGQVQIGYNSYGHLSIRIIHSAEPMQDTLIVFNQGVSNEIIDFVRENIGNKIYRSHSRNDIDLNDLPF